MTDLLLSLGCSVIGALLVWRTVWMYRGGSERARSWTPHSIAAERTAFYTRPIVALWMVSIGPIYVAGTYGQDHPVLLIGALLIVPLLVGTVLFFVFAGFDSWIPVPRFVVPSWMYDPKKGHPFSFKLHGVKRDPRARQVRLW